MPPKTCKCIQRDFHCPICDCCNAFEPETGECLYADQHVVEAEIMPDNMTREEAVATTAEINGLLEDAGRKLYDLHERKGWQAMGYASFAAYVAGELKISRRAAYHKIHHMKIVLELESVNPGSQEIPTEKETRGHASAADFLAHQERKREERAAAGAVPVTDTFPDPAQQEREPGPTAADSEPFGTPPTPRAPKRKPKIVPVATAVDDTPPAARRPVPVPRPKPAPKRADRRDIRRMDDMLPALTQIQQLASFIGDFPTPPIPEQRAHWLSELDKTMRVLRPLIEKIERAV